MPKVLVLRHRHGPADDRAAVHLQQAGYQAVECHPFAGEPIPVLDGDYAGLIVHGGPFNADAHGEHPFLADEARAIDATMTKGLPVLGICQGAQQIAHMLGADVGPRADGLYEFGYYKITPTRAASGFMDKPLWVTQAHFHGFELPAGATCLAGNAAFPNQAARFADKVYGFQFHAEVTIEGFRRWQRADWAPYGHTGAQDKDQQDALMAQHDEAQADWFYGVLDKLFPAV